MPSILTHPSVCVALISLFHYWATYDGSTIQICRKERESVIKLKGLASTGKLPQGLLAGGRDALDKGITQYSDSLGLSPTGGRIRLISFMLLASSLSLSSPSGFVFLFDIDIVCLPQLYRAVILSCSILSLCVASPTNRLPDDLS